MPTSGWTYLERLAFAVGYRADSEIAMLWAYFDDGGGDEIGGKSVILAGSLAPLENWHRLLPEWQRVVGDRGWFHAWEWHQYGDAVKGQWEELAEVANRYVTRHFACVVPGYRVVQMEARRKEFQRHKDRARSASRESGWGAEADRI